MELEYSMKPFFLSEDYNFMNEELFDMTNEVNISEYLNFYKTSFLDAESLDKLEEYVNEKFNFVDNLTKIKYLLFKIKKNPKGIYALIKDFINLVLEEKEKLLAILFEYNFHLPFLETLMKAENIYQEKKDEIRRFIENLYNTKEDFSDLCYAQHFMKFYKNNSEGQLKVLKRIEKKNNSHGILNNFENFLELNKELNKDVKKYIIDKIIEVSMMEGGEEKNAPMFRLTFLERALRYSRLIGDKFKEDEALILQQKAAEETSQNLSSVTITLPDKIAKDQKRIMDFLEKVFGFKNTTLEKKIAYLTGGLSEGDIFFSPYPSSELIQKVFEKSEKSIIPFIAKEISLSNDRRLPDEDDLALKQLKSIYYEDHIYKISYIISLLNQDLNFIKSNLIEILSEKLDASEKGFLKEILEAYFEKRNFSFTATTIPFLERCLRKIYKEIYNKDVNTMRKAPESQVKITLTEILNDDKIKEIIGEDFIEYSKWLLNLDFEGYNTRNNTSHGFVEYNFYTQFLSNVLLHYLINVIFISKDLEEIHNKI